MVETPDQRPLISKVCIGKKVGLINLNGELLIPLQDFPITIFGDYLTHTLAPKVGTKFSLWGELYTFVPGRVIDLKTMKEYNNIMLGKLSIKDSYHEFFLPIEPPGNHQTDLIEFVKLLSKDALIEKNYNNISISNDWSSTIRFAPSFIKHIKLLSNEEQREIEDKLRKKEEEKEEERKKLKQQWELEEKKEKSNLVLLSLLEAAGAAFLPIMAFALIFDSSFGYPTLIFGSIVMIIALWVTLHLNDII